jgi:ribosomal protein L37AE/L43A
MTAEATTPCVKCRSFAVQRKSEGLFCLVCATRRTGPRTQTVPLDNMRTQGSPPVVGSETVAPCPRCQSTTIQKKAEGAYCLVCGKTRRASNSQQKTTPPTTTRPQGTPPISGPQGVSPCPRCQSTAVQRRNDGLYCSVCSRKVKAMPTAPSDQTETSIPTRIGTSERKVRMANFHVYPWFESASAARNLQKALDQLADRDPAVAEHLNLLPDNVTFDQAVNVLLQAWNNSNKAFRKIGLEPDLDTPLNKIYSLIEHYLGRWL